MPWGNFNAATPADYVIPGNPGGADPPNIFMEGDAPTFAWYNAGGSPNRTNSTYEVYDDTGALVESGSAAPSPLVLTETYPPGGYTLHVLRAAGSPDATWGRCQGLTFFNVWKASANLPAVDDNGGLHYEQVNHLDSQIMLRGAAGYGTIRLSVIRPYDPTFDSGYQTLPTIAPAVASFDTWKPADAARPVVPFIAFPYWRDGVVIRVTGGSGGTFTITVDGQTATFAYNATVAAIKAGLEALTNVGAGHVKAGEISGDGHVHTGPIEFWFWGPTAGSVTGSDVTGSGAGLTGGGTLSLLRDADGVADVVTASIADVVHYEPNNEPNAGIQGFSTAASYLPAQKAFYDVVKAADASAQVLGPCTVEVGTGSYVWLDDFFAAGGDAFLDELSVHDYNGTNGDLVLARAVWDRFTELLDDHGVTAPVWMTEWGNFAWHYGLYQPRHLARWVMTAFLIWEQYGIPKERVNYFYDMAHGFLSYPSELCSGGGQMNPAPVVNMLRVWADELFGMTYTERLDFGGDDDFTVGSRFSDGTDDVLAMMSNGATDYVVTLDVTGAGSLTVVSPHGVESTVTVAGGEAQVALANGVPTYVRVPAGVTAAPQAPSYGTDLALSATAFASGSGTGVSKINDGVLRTWYFAFTGDRFTGADASFLDDTVATSRTQAAVATVAGDDMIVVPSGSVALSEVGDEIVHPNLPANTVIRRRENGSQIQVSQAPTASGFNTATIRKALPADVGLEWAGAQDIDRVVVWCPPPWQSQGTLLDFDLQWWNGSSWVTIDTVTEPTNTIAWLADGGLSNNLGGGGSQAESYFSDRCVFVFTFASVSTTKIRVHVRDCTIGGWPDATAAAAGGQGGVRRVNIRAIRAYDTGAAGPFVPDAPTIGVATAGNAQATANWTAPADNGGSAITGYEVKTYRDSDDALLHTDTTGVVLTFLRTGLTNGVGVYFKVAAINSVGTGPQSAASNTVTPSAAPAPPVPTGLTATAISSSGIFLAWTASAGATSYNVLRSTVSGSGYALVGTPSGTSFTDSGLAPATTYYYVVQAVN